MEQKYSRDEAEKHFGAKPEEIELWKDEEGKWWWLRITTGEIARAEKEGRKAMPRRRREVKERTLLKYPCGSRNLAHRG